MWLFCRSFTFNYYNLFGSTAAVLDLNNTTHVAVLPQVHIKILIHMRK